MIESGVMRTAASHPSMEASYSVLPKHLAHCVMSAYLANPKGSSSEDHAYAIASRSSSNECGLSRSL